MKKDIYSRNFTRGANTEDVQAKAILQLKRGENQIVILIRCNPMIYNYMMTFSPLSYQLHMYHLFLFLGSMKDGAFDAPLLRI